MKTLRISISVLMLVAFIMLLGSCSSSKKSSAYPKRLQRSVKCSACATVKTINHDDKIVIVASAQPFLPNNLLN